MHRRSFIAIPMLTFAARAMALTNNNEALSDLAYMFFDDKDKPTYGVKYLEPSKLDFSVDSLAHVDAYLEKIRVEEGVQQEWNRVVLRAGAYVGEVVRRHSTKTRWQWIGHEDAATIAPKLFASAPKSIATAAVLHDGQSGLAFPLAKVEKYLDNGSEDSVKFFAEVIIQRSS